MLHCTQIRAAGATDPRDVHEANISNKGLRCVNQGTIDAQSADWWSLHWPAEDLSFFTELVAIDADDNQLSLDSLSSLPLLVRSPSVDLLAD